MSIPATVTGEPTLELPRNVMIAQKQEQAILIWTIGAFCIFGWEYIICLPREYRLIWRRPMNISSALYLANRYFGIVKFSFAISLISGAWNPSTCKKIFFFQPVGGLISTLISQTILGGRVYAIFSQSKAIGFPLVAMLVTEAIVCAIAISKILPSPILGPDESSQAQCGVFIGPFGWLVTFWTMPLLFDTVTFLLTAWRAYGLWKKQMNVGTHGIFDIIWRDGLLYFFAIFSMNTINVIIFLTTAKPLRAVNLPATLILEVVLSCRLVLNLRESCSRSNIGMTNQKWSDSIKLRSVPSQGTPSGEKRIHVHSFETESPISKNVSELRYSPDTKIKPDQEAGSTV